MKLFFTYPRTSIIASNETAKDGGEWLLASRYGVYGNKLGRQKVSKAIAEKLVAAFEKEKAAAINEQGTFEGLPVFVGHPDVDPQKYPDHRRYGSILGMEARDKGLFVRVAWNDLGTHNKEQKHFVYPSVAWEIEDHGDGTVTPSCLVSVGLTNRPNMRDVPAWVNEAPAEEMPSNESTDNPETTTDMKLMQRLRELLALTDTATEDDILAALEAHFTNSQKQAEDLSEAQKMATAANERATALEAQLATATNERNDATAKLLAANEARRDTLIKVAINEGRLTEADKGAVLVAFNEDFDKAVADLEARKKTHDTQSIGLNGGAARQALRAANEKAELVQVAVNERMSAKGEDYTTAYLAVKKAQPHLFTAA